MSDQIRALQALRGVACLSVVAIHIGNWEATMPVEMPLLSWCRGTGYLGVDLFFVISGFIITWTQDKHIGNPAVVGQYLGKRFWRIYPLYWACWIGALLLNGLEAGQIVRQHGWRSLWRRQLLLWPSDPATHFLPVAWSLSYELMFYLAFAAIIALPRRWMIRILATWTAGIAASMVLLDVQTNWNCPPISPLTMEFLIGCWTAIALRRVSTGSIIPLLAAGVGIVAALLSFHWNYAKTFSPWRPLIIGMPCGMLIFALSQRERCQGLRLPNWLCRIGDASYSLYLTHWTVGVLVVFLTVRWSHTPLWHPWWVALMLGSMIGAGWLTYISIERPLMRMMRGRRRQRHAGLETVAPQPPARAA